MAVSGILHLKVIPTSQNQLTCQINVSLQFPTDDALSKINIKKLDGFYITRDVIFNFLSNCKFVGCFFMVTVNGDKQLSLFFSR